VKWLLLLALLVASSASAQTIGGASVGGAASGNLNARDVHLCLVPDTQNAASQSDFDSEPTPCGVTPGFCTGASCTSSPYCSVDWGNTGAILLQNLAHSLTGNMNAIDYSAIKGPDNVRSGAQYPVDHPACDAILSLGDMLDVPSSQVHAENGLIEVADIATLELAGYAGQIERINYFWQTIKTSGKPYMPLQGNHDPWSVWHALIDDLDIESESWFYSLEPTYRMSLAILIPNASGRPICAIGVAYADFHYDVTTQPTRGATLTSWLTSVWGCGGNNPTVYLQHDIAGAEPEPIAPVAGAYLREKIGCNYSAWCNHAGTAGMGELFMFAGGHWIGDSSAKTQITALFGADPDASVVGVFSNWQEANRHNVNDGGNGITNSDGNGTMYTVVSISPGTKTICGHDWNPYWQVRSGDGNGQVSSSTVTSEACFPFDFDAR